MKKEEPCKPWKCLDLYLGSLLSSWSFPGGSVVKKLPANPVDVGLILGSGRSLREGNGNALQYPCLGNSMGWGAWWATSLWGCNRIRHDWRTKQLSSPNGNCCSPCLAKIKSNFIKLLYKLTFTVKHLQKCFWLS